eukprot:Skav206570  [mRNA]  locus=scaffold925:251013:258684:- [translate_table: standard]
MVIRARCQGTVPEHGASWADLTAARIHKHDPATQLPAKPTLQDLAKASRELFQQKQTVEHLEGLVIGKMKEFWSGMINKCIPIGQRLPVPRNCFAAAWPKNGGHGWRGEIMKGTPHIRAAELCAKAPQEEFPIHVSLRSKDDTLEVLRSIRSVARVQKGQRLGRSKEAKVHSFDTPHGLPVDGADRCQRIQGESARELSC